MVLSCQVSSTSPFINPSTIGVAKFQKQKSSWYIQSNILPRSCKHCCRANVTDVAYNIRISFGQTFDRVGCQQYAEQH